MEKDDAYRSGCAYMKYCERRLFDDVSLFAPSLSLSFLPWILTFRAMLRMCYSNSIRNACVATKRCTKPIHRNPYKRNAVH